jgi:hypothetical protein
MKPPIVGPRPLRANPKACGVLEGLPNPEGAPSNISQDAMLRNELHRKEMGASIEWRDWIEKIGVSWLKVVTVV